MDIQLTCNTPDEQLFANVEVNASRPLPWVKSQGARAGHAVLVGGGPSLCDTFSSVQARIAHGQTVFALNGACRFLNERSVVPDYQVIMDARPGNIDLLGNARHYLLASQCDPSLFARVPPDAVTVWHPAMEGIEPHLPEYDHAYALIGGGNNVGIAAMCLVYAMGFRNLHLHGYDCSHRDGEGHAYAQPMNAHDPLCKVTLNGKTFTCSLTMARQAELFPDLVEQLNEAGCTITVDSGGLIREVVETMNQSQGASDALH